MKLDIFKDELKKESNCHRIDEILLPIPNSVGLGREILNEYFFLFMFLYLV
jgi:hypothetical protein